MPIKQEPAVDLGDITTIPASQLLLDDVAPRGPGEVENTYRAMQRRVLAILKYAEGECNCRPQIHTRLREIYSHVDRLMAQYGDMSSDFQVDGYQELVHDDEGMEMVDELEELTWALREDESSERSQKANLGDLRQAMFDAA